MTRIMHIWWKELVDLLRDRRTVIMTIVLPAALISGILVGQTMLGTRKALQEDKEVLRLGYHGDPILQQYLDQAYLEPVAYPDPVKAVKVRELPAALDVKRLQDGSLQVRFYYDSGKSEAEKIGLRVETALERYRWAEAARRITVKGLPTNLLDVATYQPIDLLDRSIVARIIIASFVPLLIVSLGIVGNVHAAVDLGAGEKERGTLERLLASPAERVEIALGKWLALVTLTLGALFFMIFVVLIVLGVVVPNLVPSQTKGLFMFAIKLSDIAVMLVGGGLIAATGGAVQLSLSIWAKSAREAQLYLSYLPFIVLVPAIILTAQGPQAELPPWIYSLPVIGIFAMIRDSLTGILVMSNFYIVTAANLVTAGVFVYLCTRILKSETAVLRS